MMAQLPESITNIAREAATKYENDIDKAVEEALKKSKALPDFQACIEAMLASAVRSMVSDWRHADNQALRKATGVYGTGPRVSPEDTAFAMGIYDDILKYRIAGKTLALVTGDEIEGIIAGESARAEGHLFNVRLLSAIQPLVPATKTVGQAVSKRKLEAIWKGLR